MLMFLLKQSNKTDLMMTSWSLHVPTAECEHSSESDDSSL